VGLAARGLRNLGRGEEPVDDSLQANQLRRQARRIHLLGLTAAALATGLCVLLPR
jgi:hypothetical protein